MGCCVSSDESFDYERELRKQTVLQGVEKKNVSAADLEAKGCSPIIVNATQPDLIRYPFDGKTVAERCGTIWHAFQRSVRNHPARMCLGARKRNPQGVGIGPYTWLNYKETDAEVRQLACALGSIGLKKGSTVGICSANRPEWTLVQLAAHSQSMVPVALYDSLAADAVEFITNHSETRITFVSPEKLPAVLGVLGRCPGLEYVVLFTGHPRFTDEANMGKVSEADEKVALQHNKFLISYTDFLKRAGNGDFPSEEPAEEDLAYIMYTSGTTGQPKGAMLQHRNVMAAISGATLGPCPVYETDRHLSYLPAAHIFECVMQVSVMTMGGQIGFYSGQIRHIVEDMRALKPTLFAGVPRVFSRFYSTTMKKFSQSCTAKLLMLKTYRQESAKARRGIVPNVNAKMDKVRALLGLQDCRVVITGSAPVAPYLMEFIRVVVHPRDGVIHGYGMTETAAAISASLATDHCMGHVGPPVPCTEVRLKDVPDMKYSTSGTPVCGEILVRGPSVFAGYYKNMEATEEALVDGWLHTGDIGRLNPNNTISIIDRKKNMFKLAQGEYIAAEKIEVVLQESPLIAQSWVYGNSHKPFLVAVVVPSIAETIEVLREHGAWDSYSLQFNEQVRRDFLRVVKENSQVVREAVMNSIKELATTHGLRSYEVPRGVVLEADLDQDLQGFTRANECVTPTFKLRRPALLQRYKERIKAKYTQLGEPPTKDEIW